MGWEWGEDFPPRSLTLPLRAALLDSGELPPGSDRQPLPRLRLAEAKRAARFAGRRRYTPCPEITRLQAGKSDVGARKKCRRCVGKAEALPSPFAEVPSRDLSFESERNSLEYGVE